jgi:N-acetylglutamate synthase-like GNAT family acetyltransferase
MFISRASRHDKADVEDFLERQGWKVEDIDSGVFFFARDGAIVGCLRVVEVAPQTLVLQDMVVDEARRGQGIGEQLVTGAMSSRGGTIYLRCLDAAAGFYRIKLGFRDVSEEELPAEVRAHFDALGDLEGGDTHYLTAR